MACLGKGIVGRADYENKKKETCNLVESNGHCSGTPNPYNVSEKYWRYTSNLYRSMASKLWRKGNAAVHLQFVLQYASHLYPAVRLPFVPAILLRKYQGLGVPESS